MNNILLTFLLHSVNNNNCKRKLCNIFILLNFDNEKKKGINSATNSSANLYLRIFTKSRILNKKLKMGDYESYFVFPIHQYR